jgi:class 3 adenylate cyclase
MAEVANTGANTDNISPGDYQQQTILNLYNSGIPIEIIAGQVNLSEDKVQNIIEKADAEERRKKVAATQAANAPSLGLFYLDTVIDIESDIKDAQTRIWKALKVRPDFNFSMGETYSILERFAGSKINLVILYVDIVESTRLSMTLPVDRLATIVQAFAQEMSLMVRAYGGYVLKYVGDAIIAFFHANSDGTDMRMPCINAIGCAQSMVKIVQAGINPILDEYFYPEISVRIGIDVGENAVIQSGWDIHHVNDYICSDSQSRHEQRKQEIKISHYDILSYTMNIATKMTALARPNGIVIGQLVYEKLDERQRSIFELLRASTEVWNYLSNNTGGIYQVYINSDQKVVQN